MHSERMKNMRNKILKILAALTAVILICLIAIFSNSLMGNPISKALARKTAINYIAENYPDPKFYLDRLSYNFKDGNYNAYIKYRGSTDIYFTVFIGMYGNIKRDSYEDDVVSGFNTLYRLDDEYRRLTDSVFKSSDFNFKSDISFGELSSGFDEQMRSNLIPDKIYDIMQLGAESGKLVIYVQDETVNTQRAAEIILKIKSLMDTADVPFHSIDFVLRYPKEEVEVSTHSESVTVRGFLYSDIYASALEERIKAAADSESKAVSGK